METKNFLYCFVLGTNHSLCKAEILNLLDFTKIPFEVIESSRETLIIQAPLEIEKIFSINDFGSTAKLVKIFNYFPELHFWSEFKEKINQKEFKNSISNHPDKSLTFGISLYHSGTKFKKLISFKQSLPKIAQEIKKKLNSLEKESWFLIPKNRFLTSVSADKNLLKKNGIEFVICLGKENVYFGKTLVVQDYQSYSFRDYGRPKRDPHLGMIPPKVAKMMINLARKDKKSTFLDPFCGCGTFLQELILLGYQKIIGSDINQQAIKNTQANLEWLFKNYPSLNKKDFQIKLINCDARQLSSKIPQESIQAIVSEPYLGPPNINLKKISQEIKKIEKLYLEAFLEFKKVLSDDGVIVIIFPVFRVKNQFFYLNILEKIQKLGFKNKGFLTDKIKSNYPSCDLEITERNSIIYYRPGQTVSREILIFSKK